MKVRYNVDEERKVTGELELDSDQEWEWEQASTDAERRRLIEGLVVVAAEDHDETLYSRRVDFCVYEDDDGDSEQRD